MPTQLDTEVPAPSGEPTEIAPGDLSVQHLGHYATVRWDENKYDIGKIVAVSADGAEISVKLDGIETPVSFQRDGGRGGPATPRLYVWI